MLKIDAGAGKLDIGERGTVDIINGTLDSAGANHVTNEGLLHVGENGLIELSNGAQLINAGGTISGTGTINLGGTMLQNNGGILAPGDSPGALEVLNGDYAADINAVLQIEIAGNGPGEFDSLHVAGNVALGGTLEIMLLDDYRPALHETFDFLEAGSFSGAFDAIICTACAGREFELSFAGGFGTLSVTAVPLPASIVLFAAALATLLPRVRRNS